MADDWLDRLKRLARKKPSCCSGSKVRNGLACASPGAAWKAQTNGAEPRDYLGVQLDDPSFPEPVRAALFEDDGAAFLVWNRWDG